MDEMNCPRCGYPGGSYVTHICNVELCDSTGDAPQLPLIARHFSYRFKTPYIETGEQSPEDMATVRRMQARQAEAAGMDDDQT
jgi:hypothetical protein